MQDSMTAWNSLSHLNILGMHTENRIFQALKTSSEKKKENKYEKKKTNMKKWKKKISDSWLKIFKPGVHSDPSPFRQLRADFRGGYWCTKDYLNKTVLWQWSKSCESQWQYHLWRNGSARYLLTQFWVNLQCGLFLTYQTLRNCCNTRQPKKMANHWIRWKSSLSFSINFSPQFVLFF